MVGGGASKRPPPAHGVGGWAGGGKGDKRGHVNARETGVIVCERCVTQGLLTFFTLLPLASSKTTVTRSGSSMASRIFRSNSRRGLPGSQTRKTSSLFGTAAPRLASALRVSTLRTRSISREAPRLGSYPLIDHFQRKIVQNLRFENAYL